MFNKFLFQDAPLATIDAGEVSLRLSANVNLVALQVIKTANIHFKREVASIPLIAAVNLGVLANSSTVVSFVAIAAQE